MSAHAAREGLPPMPWRIASLPVDHRGFPVPFFVAKGVDGRPDHRVMDGSKMPRALSAGLCWICGQTLGAFKAFTIGPMCCITRTISEPPSHRECAEWSAQACPFLSRPHAKRRPGGFPDDAQEPAGEGLKRNPGATCVWVTKSFTPFRVANGILFRLGDPVSLSWFAEGRAATRAEVNASIETGLPLLRADEEGPDAVAELTSRRAFVTALLDKTLPAEAA